MLPSLFVGSSTEALPVAEAVQRALRHVSDVTLWTQGVFGLNQTVFETLIGKAKYYDYAVFIFSEDDLIRMRKEKLSAVRDNVVFELGFFYAVLGAKRCFFLVPSHARNFRIPSDLRGLMYATYDLESHNGNIDAIIGNACSGIISQIRSPGTLTGQWDIYIEGSNHPDSNGLFHIVQAGSKITAKLALTKTPSGEKSARKFYYEGRYLSGQIMLHFEQNGAEDVIVGSMTLKVMSNSVEIRGITTFWHHDIAEMTYQKFVLRRR